MPHLHNGVLKQFLSVVQSGPYPFSIMPTRLLLLFVLGCLCRNRMAAQLNESDTLLFQYNGALTANLQSGNLEAASLRLKADASFSPSGLWAFKTQNTYRYQEFFDRKADNDFSGRNFLYLWPRRRVYPFVLAFVSANYRRRIDSRYFTGPGLTWQLLRSRRHVVKTALSGVYESTAFSGTAYNHPEYNGRETIRTWRASAWLFGKHTLAGGRLRCYYEAFFQPSLEDGDNYRWQAEFSLEWPLWKGLGCTANYLFTHENVVVEGVKADDGLLTFGLVYSGKFK